MSARQRLETLCWVAPVPLISLALVVAFSASCGGAQHPAAMIADELEGEVLRTSRAVAAAETTCTDQAQTLLRTAAELEDVPRLARLEKAKALQHDCNVATAEALRDLEAAEQAFDAVGSAAAGDARCALAKGAVAIRSVRALVSPLGAAMPALVERALEGAERQGADCQSSFAATDGGAS